jgi:hypothetical protein
LPLDLSFTLGELFEGILHFDGEFLQLGEAMMDGFELGCEIGEQVVIFLEVLLEDVLPFG